jgi:hypothetical protein
MRIVVPSSEYRTSAKDPLANSSTRKYGTATVCDPKIWTILGWSHLVFQYFRVDKRFKLTQVKVAFMSTKDLINFTGRVSHAIHTF